VSNLIVGVGDAGDDVRNISRLGGRALTLILSVLLVAARFALAVTSPLIARLDVDTSILMGMKESAAVDEVLATTEQTRLI
jgi:hypothetical protein